MATPFFSSSAFSVSFLRETKARTPSPALPIYPPPPLSWPGRSQLPTLDLPCPSVDPVAPLKGNLCSYGHTSSPSLSSPDTLASLLFVASSAFCDAVAPMLSSCFPDCLPVPSGSWSSVDFLHCSCPQGPVLQPSALLSPHFLWGFLPPASLPIALSSPTDLGERLFLLLCP